VERYHQVFVDQRTLVAVVVRMEAFMISELDCVKAERSAKRANPAGVQVCKGFAVAPKESNVFLAMALLNAIVGQH
jgi:hypothetical protein